MLLKIFSFLVGKIIIEEEECGESTWVWIPIMVLSFDEGIKSIPSLPILVHPVFANPRSSHLCQIFLIPSLLILLSPVFANPPSFFGRRICNVTRDEQEVTAIHRRCKMDEMRNSNHNSSEEDVSLGFGNVFCC